MATTLQNAHGQILPRVTIQFCTQCKWMLRAAYFAQELLSTFGTSLGEVALQPATGGTFVVGLFYALPSLGAEGEGEGEGEVEVKEYLLWDRKAEGGFPETKELKKRVRDVIDPKRDLGHVDGKKDAVKKEEISLPAEAKKEVESGGAAENAISGGNGEEKGEVLNARGKIVIGGGGFGDEHYGYCKPEDEDCG